MKFIRWQLLKLVETLCAICSGSAHGPGGLVIVRLDEIGDYVLFRNFLEEIRRSERFGRLPITLIGNAIWRHLAEKLDHEFVDRFIWIDKKRFAHHYWYRLIKLCQLKHFSYDIAANPTFSRHLCPVADNVIARLNTATRVAFSDPREFTTENDNIYSKVIDLPESIHFEFDRNRFFFETLTSTKSCFDKPYISIRQHTQFDLPKDYAVIFIGASRSCRKWPADRFATTAQHIVEKYHLPIVLCGGPRDKNQAAEFQMVFAQPFHNLVGRTTLIDLLDILKQSKLLLSNETAAAHLAAAVGAPSIFVISNGDLFGRFAPYPEDRYANYNAIFPPHIQNELSDFAGLCDKYAYQGSMDISGITTESVIEWIDQNS